MSNGKVKLKDVVAGQLPEFIREQYPTFVSFVEAYYEFLVNQNIDITKIRDIDDTLDQFVKYFKAELAHNYPISDSIDTERYLLKHIKDQYLAKGSEASYKLLFRLLYSKDVYMDYPGKQMLRVSDGRWQQDVSIFVRADLGDPYSLIGKIVDVQTSKKIYRTSVVPGTAEVTKITANVENVIQFQDNIYELFLDRNFYGDIYPGDVIKYQSDFQGQILPCTSKIKIQNRGVNFKPGQVFQVSSGDGSSIWFKVLTTKPDGGLGTIDLIKFGLGYSTDFAVTVLPTSAVTAKRKVTQSPVAVSYSLKPNTIGKIDLISGGSGYTVAPDVIIGGNGTGATAHAVISGGVVTSIVVDNEGEDYTTAFVNIIAQPGDTGSGAEGEVTIGSVYSYEYKDNTSGFTEGGYLNWGDYWDHEFSDGAYAGTIARQFFVDAKDTISGNPALLNVSIGAIAKYPGYYKTNDGFLDDSMFIQDSYYYQSFSYVIRIDEQLQSYASVVRSMLHPSGMAMFGEYSINNDIQLRIALDSIVKSLGVTLYDTVSVNDDYVVDENGVVIRGTFLSTIKDFSDANIAPIDLIQRLIVTKVLEEQIVTITEPLLTKVLGKRFGFTGQTESVFTGDDGSKKLFTKTASDSYSITEDYTKKLIFKNPSDFQSVSENFAMVFTLNTIVDPLPGIYPEDGVITMNPYDQGGYFLEHYANERYTFSS